MTEENFRKGIEDGLAFAKTLAVVLVDKVDPDYLSYLESVLSHPWHVANLYQQFDRMAKAGPARKVG